MERSNKYILLYTAALTIACGVLLAVASQGLKSKQQEQIDLEFKRNILSTFMTIDKTTKVQEIFAKKVLPIVVDFKGKEVNKKFNEISIEKEYKKPLEDRNFPIYEIRNDAKPDSIDFYVMPVFGNGLWDVIWGYVALENDMNTIKGVVMAHKAETPGLGARITDEEIQKRYIGKKIFDSNNQLVSITMIKGEGHDTQNQPNNVDGMSGATLTAKGVNKMFKNYFEGYLSFIQSKRSQYGKK